MVITRKASSNDIHAVRDLYVECGYGGGIESCDIVLIAEEDNKLVGAVRLCPAEGTTILRGMQVRKSHQRRGIGRLLLTECERLIVQGDSYCLPYTHLVKFYGAAGFEVVEKSELPVFLRHRLERYEAERLDVLAMKRVPSNLSFHTDASRR